MTVRLSTIAIVTWLAGMTASGIAAHAQTPKSIRIGYAISLSGPNAPGAGITVLPNYRLWVKEVNAAGGIMLKSVGRRVPIEVIEYDDHSNVGNAVEAVERLIAQDKGDFILSPWGTGLNVAVGPLLHRAGYPHLAVTALSDDPFFRTAFGEAFVDYYVHIKNAEIERFQAEVSEWEHREYFEMF